MSGELEELCETAGVLLTRLPPYSCDYNPIETSFAESKKWIKRHGDLVQAHGAEEGGFGGFLQHAIMAQRGGHDPGSLFRLAGISFNRE